MGVIITIFNVGYGKAGAGGGDGSVGEVIGDGEGGALGGGGRLPRQSSQLQSIMRQM